MTIADKGTAVIIIIFILCDREDLTVCEHRIRVIFEQV